MRAMRARARAMKTTKRLVHHPASGCFHTAEQHLVSRSRSAAYCPDIFALAQSAWTVSGVMVMFVVVCAWLSGLCLVAGRGGAEPEEEGVRAAGRREGRQEGKGLINQVGRAAVKMPFIPFILCDFFFVVVFWRLLRRMISC